MKTRESGMPDESTWSSFFAARDVLVKLKLSQDSGEVVDFGCGYGTFTLPAARITRGTVCALDIDPEMVSTVQAKARSLELTNVVARQRDFMAAGTGLPAAGAGYAMLFNILHCEQPVALLREAWRVLQPGGIVAVMHWNYDPTTPRGPSMNIRPRPEQCRQWTQEAGFDLAESAIIHLPPYHYGFAARKPARPAR